MTKCVCISFTEVTIGSLTLFIYIKSYCFMFLNQLSGSCGTPHSLLNGQRRYSSTTVGSTVTYTCNTGYLMTAGSSSRTCRSSGRWSRSHPTCTCKSTLCHFISLTCKRIADIYLVYTKIRSISKTYVHHCEQNPFCLVDSMRSTSDAT